MASPLPSVAVQQKARTVMPVPPSSRLMSLDLFRGATIAGMILVNNAGDEASSYWPLRHAKWNGWTPTDLVFPFFLFIVGVSMVFSFQSRLDKSRLGRGDSRTLLLFNAFRRGATIFAIGLAMNYSLVLAGSSRFPGLRIPGVLQRIGVCYIAAAVLF